MIGVEQTAAIQWGPSPYLTSMRLDKQSTLGNNTSTTVVTRKGVGQSTSTTFPGV